MAISGHNGSYIRVREHTDTMHWRVGATYAVILAHNGFDFLYVHVCYIDRNVVISSFIIIIVLSGTSRELTIAKIRLHLLPLEKDSGPNQSAFRGLHIAASCPQSPPRNFRASGAPHHLP